MKHYFKHIGYYNCVGDIRELRTATADEIINYWKKGFGAFHSVSYHEEDSDFCLEDEFEDGNILQDFMRDSSGEYVILNEGRTWDEWDEQYGNKEDDADSDCYIDIYQLYKVTDNNMNFYRAD